jgi:hypothetical protein
MKTYEDYANIIDDYTSKINLCRATKDSSSKGATAIVSRIVFSKAIWQEALTYFSILQAIIIFTALIPTAIDNVNSVFLLLNIPIQFPVHLSSLIALSFIVFLFIFGYVGYRKLRTPAIAQGYGSKNNSATYLLWCELEEIKEQIKELRK